MQNILCLSVYKNRNWPETNIAAMLDIAKNLDISGIELVFGTSKELFSFSLSGQDINWIKKLKYVSIHAPFEPIKLGSEVMLQQLKWLSYISARVNAQNIVIHPPNLPRPELLSKYGLNVCTENTKKTTVSELKKIFKNYPQLKLCLDVSHSYLRSETETSDLVRHFREKIVQIHLSCAHNGKDHLPLRGASDKFLKSIQIIKTLNVPIIIEENVVSADINNLRAEIKLAKSLI